MASYFMTSKLLKEWVAKACEDLEAAQILFKNRRKNFSALVCFHCHQFAEKYLKAFLISLGTQPPRIHHLAKLLDLAVEKEPALELIRDLLDTLEAYGVDVRYPGNHPPRTAARKALKASEQLKKFLDDHFKGSAL